MCGQAWVRKRKKEERMQALHNYQINQEVLAQAAQDAIVLHCLPAHRGEEITEEVLEGKQSVVLTKQKIVYMYRKQL